MPFTVEIVNADALAKSVGTMIGRITYFGGVEMPKELSDWQVQDMHRKRPATKSSRWRRGIKKVQTLIRPHSRYETQRSQAYQKRLQRRLRRKRKKPISDFIQLKRSTRPILRDNLFPMLVNRMTQAMKETITWK